MTLQHALAKLARLMSPERTETLDPIQLARALTELEGSLNIRDLKRFEQAIEGYKREVQYWFRFFLDDEGHYCIEGRISADVQLICQRCLTKMAVTLNAESKLAVVKSLEEAREMPKDLDPVINDKTLSLKELVEEELLLALPDVPMHSVDDCPIKLESTVYEKESKQNPFADLSKLKVKK